MIFYFILFIARPFFKESASKVRVTVAEESLIPDLGSSRHTNRRSSLTRTARRLPPPPRVDACRVRLAVEKKQRPRAGREASRVHIIRSRERKEEKKTMKKKKRPETVALLRAHFSKSFAAIHLPHYLYHCYSIHAHTRTYHRSDPLSLRPFISGGSEENIMYLRYHLSRMRAPIGTRTKCTRP